MDDDEKELDEKEDGLDDEEVDDNAKKDGADAKEKVPEIPPEWERMNIKEFFDAGFRPSIKRVGAYSYITLKKGNTEKSLGTYSEERWRALMSIYPRKVPSQLPPIEEKLKELGDKVSRDDAAKLLYEEGYPTQELMRVGLPLKSLKIDRKDLAGAMEGNVRGPGYVDELKHMITKQISLSREFAEACTNAGVQVVLAALKKTPVAPEEYRAIFKNVDSLTSIVDKATDTALRALDAYNSDQYRKLEEERDEARFAYSMMAARMKELTESLDPSLSIEKMIHTYLMSGNVDPNVLMSLLDKWLTLKFEAIKAEAIEQ